MGVEHAPRYVSELCLWDRATISQGDSRSSYAVSSVHIQEGHVWSRVQKLVLGLLSEW